MSQLEGVGGQDGTRQTGYSTVVDDVYMSDDTDDLNASPSCTRDRATPNVSKSLAAVDQEVIEIESDTEPEHESPANTTPPQSKGKDVVGPTSGSSAFTANHDASLKHLRTLHRTRRFDEDDMDLDMSLQKYMPAAGPSRTRGSRKAMVGRKPKVTRKRKRDVDMNSDEYDETALLEGTLPSYLRQRRASFDERHEKLKEAGLVLPPEYDDIDFSGDERINQLGERPQFTHIKPIAPYKDIKLRTSAGTIPAPIAQWLRDYQVQGAEFMHEAFVYQKGVILGDDMGLGKTIQVISFLTAAFGKTADERDAKRMRKVRRKDDGAWYPKVMIVAPGTLMSNWQSELDRWGWWTVYQCHGQYRQDALDAAMSGRLEIMLTTYNTYCKYADAINEVKWDCVIADECHILKSNKALATRQMNDVNALCRIGLTGTAIQNNYEELWTILNWSNPGQLGTLAHWKLNVSGPLRAGQSHDATVAQLAKSRNTAEELVQNLLPRFFLRRMKSLIADQLPKKSDKVVFCPLTELQEAAYANFCDSDVVLNILGALGGGSGNDPSWRPTVFPALITLQKIANHLALLVPNSSSEPERHDAELELLQSAVPSKWKDMYAGRDSIRNYANQEFCGKWRVLKKMLKLWHENGDKVLVFSHSVRLLKMLHTLFGASTTYTVSYLDGSMSYADRQAVVDDFNSSAQQFVFLISTKAGGVGLNITSANKVVVVDPNWNPAWDLQAQDRAYRIGQTRDVDVFRLVSANTIEENIYARQIYKQQQANIGYNASAERRYFKGVQADGQHKGEIFGLANLLARQHDNVALREIVNKTNIAETRAGVEIAGLDLESCHADDDDEDDSLHDSEAAISAWAQEILDEPGSRRHKAKQIAKKKDPIQAVLDAAGVKYTHENAEVIGSSKIEMQISSRARKAGGNAQWNGERAFIDSQLSPPVFDDNIDSETSVAYKYKPPEDVCCRQFCSMAKAEGYDKVSDFALVVEGWSQVERRKFLDRWYRKRREALAM